MKQIFKRYIRAIEDSPGNRITKDKIYEAYGEVSSGLDKKYHCYIFISDNGKEARVYKFRFKELNEDEVKQYLKNQEKRIDKIIKETEF